MQITNTKHISERAVFADDIPVDVTVENIGTIKDLENSVKDVVDYLMSMSKLKEKSYG